MAQNSPVGPSDVQRWLPAFKYFLSLITIKSKDLPQPQRIVPYTAQLMALNEIAAGLKEDVHHFVCLKARQLGMSTVFMALDIFWLFMFPGLQGAFVCDTEQNRESFRRIITDMMDSLPAGYKIPVTTHNRNGLTLANGSVMQYMSAGKGKNSGLGRSRALNFLHATELSSWGDQKGYETLMDALSTENPNRLFLFESTALGYNLFYDAWGDAIDDDIAKRAFFIGWWAKERVYRFKEDSADFDRWWGSFPEYTPYEAEVTLKVHEKYGIEITPMQWAWYRKMADGRSEQNMMSEYPSLPEEAFQATGSPFFNVKRINQDIQYVTGAQIGYDGYRYELGDDFLKMKMRRVDDPDEVDLRVWEGPRDGAKYAIGCDPAYGSSADADNCVISVWRCFADKLVQVAEYSSSVTTTQNCAWVLAHIAGEYRDSIINLEINGPGQQVMMELKYLRQSIQFGALSAAARELKLEHILDSARWFLWRKPDQIGGMPTAYNFKTTQDTKSVGLNGMRDSYITDALITRSIPLLDEFTTLRQDGDSIAAQSGRRDDRVMAAMLAHYAWREWIRPGMMSNNRTFAREKAEEANRQGRGNNVLAQIVPAHFADQAQRREQAEMQRLLEGRL